MSRVVCGCSVVIMKIQDGKNIDFAGECEICVSNGGRYDRSPFWKEQKIIETTVQDVKDKYKGKKK